MCISSCSIDKKIAQYCVFINEIKNLKKKKKMHHTKHFLDALLDTHLIFWVLKWIKYKTKQTHKHPNKQTNKQTKKKKTPYWLCWSIFNFSVTDPMVSVLNPNLLITLSPSYVTGTDVYVGSSSSGEPPMKNLRRSSLAPRPAGLQVLTSIVWIPETMMATKFINN